MDRIISFLDRYISIMTIPKPRVTDVIEILIISFLIYKVASWIRNTKAYALLRGIVVIFVFVLVAFVFQMNTILWIVKNASVVAITALIVIFQPELRKALETLGKKNVLSSILPFDDHRVVDTGFSDKTISEIVKACFEMGRVKTGALIVIARENSLSEIERTGIDVDAIVSSQLLINIFEHNTPLHDGAVVIRGNRVVSATCYLPLSDNLGLSKDLGTRHRAGVGVSEVTDSITVIVSEETGRVSVAINGVLSRNLNADEVREKLSAAKPEVTEEKKFLWWKQRRNDEG